MKQLIRVVSMVVVITGFFSPESAFCKDAALVQKTFAKAETAAEALGAAYKSDDLTSIAAILGEKGFALASSGDPVIDRHEREWFLTLFKEGHEVVSEGDDRAVLQIGREEYPYPVPIVKRGKKWSFDTDEGHEDLLSRRIAKAELSALDIMGIYMDAQFEYRRKDHNGDGVLEYAQKFRSSPDRHDGLYWEEKPGDSPSPVAALADAVHKEGYTPAQEGRMTVYRGYFYKILKAQGGHAPGGARQYVVDGKMTGGFALAAFPVRYGISGVLTFIVNQDGVVYQKDLGAETVALGPQMTAFDPDETWTKGRQKVKD